MRGCKGKGSFVPSLAWVGVEFVVHRGVWDGILRDSYCNGIIYDYRQGGSSEPFSKGHVTNCCNVPLRSLMFTEV